MKRVFDLLKVSWVTNEKRVFLYNHVPRRGIKYQENIKWVKPEKKPKYHSARSGDLAPFPVLNKDSVYYPFTASKELEKADEDIKKIFSLRRQLPRNEFEMYENQLVESVKRHAFDDKSPEVQIAKATARIRYYQKLIFKRPTKEKKCRYLISMMIDARKKKLKNLRLVDYKRFEWLLEKLDLEYRPPVPVLDSTVTRKKSITRLAKLKVEQTKEEKLAELRKSFDEQKIPFLEKKITSLKQIKEMEEKNNLPPTVTESDIEECVKKLEQVKIEIKGGEEKRYKRKIHPYFLEPYDEEILWKQEKAGELIREKQELEKEKRSKNEA